MVIAIDYWSNVYQDSLFCDRTDSLPDMSWLSCDELEYCCTLLSSGERYRPYEASE